MVTCLGGRCQTGATMAMMTRRLLIAAAASAATGRLAAEPAAPVLPFVVIGDWGRRGAQSQREVGVTLGQAAAASQSRFTISVGDNFYENGVTGVDDPQWDDSFERIYDAPSLQSPWYSILGNHDYRGSVEAQLHYGGPRWTMPARYYDRSQSLADGTKVDFFFIDTSPFVTTYRETKVRIDGQDTAAQLVWLDRKLSASTAAWRIVVGHHPVYTATGGHFDTADLIGQLAPMLQRYRVQAYLCGHVHNLQQTEMDGVCYVISGAGSKVQRVKTMQRPGFALEQHGFVVARLDRDALAMDFVDVSGSTLYQSVVHRA